MPPRTFALLILSVIAAGGATVALAVGLGLPPVALGLAALAGTVILAAWRRR